MYVPVPHKLIFFRKIPRTKKALFVYVGLAKSIFIGQIYFHWWNLFCGIYDVRPSATKTNFFSKIPSLIKCFVSQWGIADFVGLPLISSIKVVKSTSSCKKSLIITFMLRDAH